MAAKFYKVASNTELVNMNPRGSASLVSCKPLFTFLLTDEYLTLFYVLPFKDTIFNNKSLTHGPELCSLNEACVAHTSIRHIAAFSQLGTLDSTSALCLGAIWNSEITNKKHQAVKNMELNGQQEETCLWYESRIKGQSVPLTFAGNTRECGATQIFLRPVPVPK